jgi:predicted GNAT family N-acyltransferase
VQIKNLSNFPFDRARSIGPSYPRKVTRDQAQIVWEDGWGKSHKCMAHVLSTSAFGIELLLQKPPVPNISPGDVVIVGVLSSIGGSDWRCVVVACHSSDNSASLICRILDISDTGVDLLERRRGPRWRCDDEFQPTGVAANPFRSNDFIQFRVVDASAEGIGALTSIRNKQITKGTVLDAIVSFPSVGSISTKLAVNRVGVTAIGERDYLFLGLEFLEELSQRHRGVLGQYLLQFADRETTHGLRASGLLPRTAVRDVECGWVVDEDSYREALNLRYAAYVLEGKAPSQWAIGQVADAYDSRSRILLCKKDSRAVATARLYFPEYGDRIEHEQFFTWPGNFPRREEVVEVTRTCTHPDHRGASVFFSLLRFIVITATQAQRSWVVTSATPDLVQFYDWIGLKPTELTFNHPNLNGLPHRVLLGNIPAALTGRSIGPGAWNTVWRDALDCVGNDVSENSLDRIRIFLFRILGPLMASVSRLLMRY